MKSVILFVLLVLTPLLGFSQEGNPLHMLGSRAELLDWAKSRIHEVYGQVSSEESVQNGGKEYFSYVSQSPLSLDEASGLLKQNKLQTLILNPWKMCYAYAAYFDRQGDLLFQGHNSFYVTNGKGGISAPANAGDIHLQLASSIAIPFDGVTEAYLVETVNTEWGSYDERRYLSVYNNKLYFPSQSVDTYKYIVLKANGVNLAYDEYGQIPLEELNILINTDLPAGIMRATISENIIHVYGTSDGSMLNIAQIPQAGWYYLSGMDVPPGYTFEFAQIKYPHHSEWLYFWRQSNADSLIPVYFDSPGEVSIIAHVFGNGKG